MVKTQSASYSFLIYEKLKQELLDYEDPIGQYRAKKILVRSLSLIPDLIIHETTNPKIIRVSSIQSPEISVEVSLQNAIDSILLLWNESYAFRDIS